ncbi:MAG: dihydrolipoyl dehydrogenase [Treponema sp.]|nr:dihydrolipoyl dehydrogenase [Treponema sp.]
MYDVIIIGGGPAGYLAAERLGHRGKKVLLIEKQHLGGTCLNAGCIPTKTLLNSAKQYLHAQDGQFGVHAEKVSFNLSEMMAWKEKVVGNLRGGLASQMKRFKVETLSGTGIVEVQGSFRGVRFVKEGEPGSGVLYETKAILAAAGSVPVLPPIPGTEGNSKLIDSTGILSVSGIPAKLCIIGGGVIGAEFASLFGMLGSEVSVVEMMDEIIPPMDKDHAPLMRKALRNTGFHLGCRVTRIEGGNVFFTDKDGTAGTLAADMVLMAVGRRAEIASWGAKEAGIDVTGKGVTVDNRMRTNISGIWAAGDVNGRSMLAHSAYRMAEVAVNDICAWLEGADSKDFMRYNAVPWAVYSNPEAAGAGITEQEALSRGIAIRTASAPMYMSGRFLAENIPGAPGTVKVIADERSGVLLGVHILGPYAPEMIWGAAALIENEMRIDDVKELVFPHPSVCEIIREAVWNF